MLSTAVLSTTAAEVGEVVVDAAPKRLGKDYVRTAGSAGRVLAGLGWHVDMTGVTVVGPRPSVPAGTGVEVMSWDPTSHIADIASDELVTPGTVLTDTRFGTLVVGDVDQTFGDSGVRASARCSSTAPAPAAGGQLIAALSAIGREASGSAHLRAYRYRVVAQAGDGRLVLQAVKRTAGVPDILPIEMAPGVPGVTAKLAPGSTVLVEFTEGDPSQPAVRGFESGPVPLEVAISAIRVAVGAGTLPTLLAAPAFLAWLSEVGTAAGVGAPPVAGATSTKLFAE